MAANYADQYNNGEIEEVFPRIWRVPVPLPDNPLNYLNSYFILSDDKTTIVDVGFDHPDCEKALDNALHKVGRTWESVEIVLTHSPTTPATSTAYGDAGCAYTPTCTLFKKCKTS